MSSSERGPSSSPDDKLFDWEGKGKTPLAFLSPEAIELLRKREHEMVREAQKEVKDHLDIDALNQAEVNTYKDFDALIDQYLKDFRIADNDPQRDDYIKMLKNNSIDAMSERDWTIGVYENDGAVTPDGIQELRLVSGREKAAKVYDSLVNDIYNDNAKRPLQPTIPPQPTDNPVPSPDDTLSDPEPEKPKTPGEIKDIVDNDPIVKACRANVESCRKRLAALSAKRQGKLKDSRDFMEEYKDAEADYKRAVEDLVKAEMDAEKAAGRVYEAEDERFEGAFKIMSHFRHLQEDSVNILKNTRIGKLMTLLTSGGTVKRIAKGVLVGATIGGIAAAVTFFTGGAALAAGLATAGVKAGSFARTFATLDNRKDGRGMKIMDEVTDSRGTLVMDTLNEADVSEESRDEAIRMIHEHLMERFETDTQKEQNKRRKSTAIALGAVVLGSLGAEGVRWLAESIFSPSGNTVNALMDKGTPSTDVQAPAGNGIPEIQGNGGQTPPKVEVFSHDAQVLHKSEGLFSEFKQMGYPKEQWSDLLKEVGPQLQDVKVNGKSLTYMMPNGQWGIRMTPDGMMPKEALNIISNTHDKMFTVNPNPTDVMDAAPSHPSGPNVEANGGGSTQGAESLVNQTNMGAKDIIKMHVIQPSEVQNTPQLDQLTHVKMNESIDKLNQTFRLPTTEWRKVEDYVASRVADPFDRLYRGVFEIGLNGDLRFTKETIPDNTMADLLNHVRTSL
jgi:hypothetical protein